MAAGDGNRGDGEGYSSGTPEESRRRRGWLTTEVGVRGVTGATDEIREEI